MWFPSIACPPFAKRLSQQGGEQCGDDDYDDKVDDYDDTFSIGFSVLNSNCQAFITLAILLFVGSIHFFPNLANYNMFVYISCQTCLN